jgi:DNA-binding transcriptional MerR regulator
MAEINQTDQRRTYQIGTVATLTGLDPHTIRGWERRYGAIKPMRSETGRRRYDDDTVERLQLLKALVDCRESISTIASLSDEALRDRLEKLADHESQGPRKASEGSPSPRRYRLAVLGEALSAQIDSNRGDLPEFDVCLKNEDCVEFLESARRERCEIVLLEFELLGRGALGFVQACRRLPGNPMVVLLYRFGARPSLARLAGTGATLVQHPIRLAQLRRIILDHIVIKRAQTVRTKSNDSEIQPTHDSIAPPAQKPPERRFTNAQLARLLEVSSSIDCECPNHVSSLVSALVAFENYSLECESRDEADALLHGRLAAETGAIRAEMESMLADLCEHEGIAVN